MSKIYPNAIRYNGAKSKQLDFIYDCFPPRTDYDCFVDLFGGGGSVILNATPTKKDIYNDINEEIVNFFSVLREEGSKLMEMLRLTPYSRAEYDEAFIYDPNDDSVEMARKTAIKAQFAYGGKGGGFKAFEREVSITKMYHNWIDGLEFIIKRFQNITIENMDALKLLKKVDAKSTLVYIDPPYIGSDNYEHNYSKKNHLKLLETIVKCDSMVIISGVPSSLYDEYLHDWVKIDKLVSNSSFKSKSNRMDILWIKPNIRNCNRFGLFGGGIANV